MDSQTKITIFAAVLFLFFIFIAWSFYPRRNQPTDFGSCVAADFPVLESFPRQCQTETRKVFVEDLSSFEKILTNIATSTNPIPTTSSTSPQNINSDIEVNTSTTF